MGLKNGDLSGGRGKLPELDEPYARMLENLPARYLQTELFREDEQRIFAQSKEDPPNEYHESPPGGPYKSYTRRDVEAVQSEFCSKECLEHIFYGNVRSFSAGSGKHRMRASGYHSECASDSQGTIDPGTKGAPDELGVYDGKVRVAGIRKRGNGYSTFFPRHWSPQHVADAVDQAFRSRQADVDFPGRFFGFSKEGVRISMYIDNGHILSFYPERKQ